MAAVRANQDVQAVLDLARVPDSADLAVTQGVLMTTVLQTLGALSLVTKERKAALKSRRVCSIACDGDAEDMLAFQLSSFAKALKCFASLLDSDHPPNALTGLLMESFPDEAAIGQPAWSCLSWHLVSPGLNLPQMRAVVTKHPSLCHEKDKFGRAPLTYAAGLDIPEPFLTLLAVFPDPVSSPSSLGCLPLHTAGRHSPSIEVVKTVLANNPEAIRHADNEECLPLHAAARRSEGVEVVKVLLSAWEEGVRTGDGVGRYPLHHAALGTASIDILDTLYHAFPEAAR